MKRKNIFNVVLAVVAAGLLFSTGCGKKESNPDNHFVYQDTTYALSQGFISSYQIFDSLYEHTVLLLSDGFTVVWETGNPSAIDSISGRGNGIIFNMIGLSKDGLEDGTYTGAVSSSKSFDLPADKTWDFGTAVMNYSDTGDNDNVGTEVDFKKGNITVKNLGNNRYEFSFDVTSEENHQLTGYFKATLKPFVFDNKKSLKTGSRLYY